MVSHQRDAAQQHIFKRHGHNEPFNEVKCMPLVWWPERMKANVKRYPRASVNT